MSLSFWFFIIMGGVIAAIDARKEIIPDKLILPSIAILASIMFFEGALTAAAIFAAIGVAVFFIIIIYFFTDFGGGDIRYGVFCALFLGFPDIFVFFIFAGIIHTALISALSKKIAGFALAMYLGAIGTKIFASYLWGLS